jgi:hypothetical protein
LPLRSLFGRRLVSRDVQLGRETRGPHVVAVSDGAVLNQDTRHGPKTYPRAASNLRRSRALPGGRLSSERGTLASGSEPPAPQTIVVRHRSQGGSPRGNQGFPRA